jgi:CO/xanthine dehydrogenase Mo-binding subunit
MWRKRRPRATIYPMNCAASSTASATKPYRSALSAPATSHRLGIRAGGEGGTTPALGTVVNAVVDALSEFGVKHIELPVTAERVWRAIRAATAA